MKINFAYFMQKANPLVFWFVVFCTIIISALLYISVKSQALAENINSHEMYSVYLSD